MPDPRQICSITAVVTAGCNLACSYCYQNVRSGRRMRWQTLRAAIDCLLASHQDELELGFYGGEPLLGFDLIRRAVVYAEGHQRPGQKVDYSMLTNGTLLGDEEATFLAEHAFLTQLSFDGTPEAQALRGEGTFELLDRLLLRLLRDHRNWFEEKVSVSITVLPATVRHLADGVDYFLGRGVREIGFSPVVTDTSGWRLEDSDELEAQFARILALSHRHYRDTGHIPVECLRKVSGPRRRPRPQAMCNVERADQLTVDVDGEVYGCAVFAESFQEFPSDFLRRRLSSMRLGALSAPELPERMASFPAAVEQAEIFHRQDLKGSGYGRCRECAWLEHCLICPVAIGHIPGNSDPHRIPDFLCAFSQVMHRFRERFVA